MEQISYYISLTAFAIVIVTWFVFAGAFLFRIKLAPKAGKISAPRSWAGLILQALSFSIVWTFRRPPAFSPIIEGQYILNIVLQILTVPIAIVSAWLAMAAVKELGKQWSLQARVLKDHKLITTGVYQIVRHPIYTSMLGMLAATGITYSHWIGLIAAVIVFIIGTRIRTSFEEDLLRDAFGQEFTDWEAKVPGLIPFVRV